MEVYIPIVWEYRMNLCPGHSVHHIVIATVLSPCFARNRKCFRWIWSSFSSDIKNINAVHRFLKCSLKLNLFEQYLPLPRRLFQTSIFFLQNGVIDWGMGRNLERRLLLFKRQNTFFIFRRQKKYFLLLNLLYSTKFTTLQSCVYLLVLENYTKLQY